MVTDAAARPRAADVAVAAGCWVVLVAVLTVIGLLAAGQDSSVLVEPPGSRGWWLTFAVVTAQAVALVWLRASPRAVLVAVACLPLPLSLADTADSFSVTGLAVLVAVLLTGLRLPWRRVRSAVAVATVVLVVGVFVNGLVDGRLGVWAALAAAGAQAVGVVGIPLLVAGAIAGQREAHEAGRRELQAVAREHDALVRTAVAQERTAMARELHDIAAHHLSGIALMAAAIDRQIDTDPETAKRSVRQVRAQSTAVLDDLRRLVGLMREDDEAPRSVASLGALPELVEQRRAGGAPVELRTLPAAGGRPLGEGVGTLAQLAVYRIAQESLTNAATHAPGAATVVEVDDRRDDALVLTVTNEPGLPDPSSTSGFGLLGMQERADLLGATLRYGPRPGAGWQVRLEVPRDLSGRGGPPPGRQEEGT
jgi:signal transduction histidine kinase